MLHWNRLGHQLAVRLAARGLEGTVATLRWFIDRYGDVAAVLNNPAVRLALPDHPDIVLETVVVCAAAPRPGLDLAPAIVKALDRFELIGRVSQDVDALQLWLQAKTAVPLAVPGASP